MIPGGDPKDPVGRWLVEVGYAVPGVPAPWRWSTEDLSVYTADGALVAYRAGLVSLAGTAADDGTIDADAAGSLGSDVDVTVRDPAVPWSRMDPSLPCVVRRWLPGDVLERADVIARGTLADLEYGAVGESVQWSIGPDPAPIAVMLDELARADNETWPVDGTTWLPTEQHAAYAPYPLVFGHPSSIPVVVPRTTRDGSFYFDPWYVISSDPATFLPVATYPADVDGTRVPWLIFEDGAGAIFPSLDVPTVATVTIDGRGRPCVTLHAAQKDGVNPTIALPAQADEKVYCSVFADYATIEGKRTLDEVLEYVLGRWAAGSVDWGLFRAVAPALANFKVDTWVSERVPLWGWVASILEHLPFRLRRSSAGLYLVEHRVTVAPGFTTREFDASSGDVSRAGRVLRTAGSGPFSELRIVYGDNPVRGDMVGFLTYLPDNAVDPVSGGDPFGAPGVLPHPLLTAARARGVYATREIEVPWTHDDDTAARVAEYQITRDALPHRRVTYRVPERWRVTEASQVSVSDPEVGIAAGTLAVVDRPPELTDTGALVTLRIPDGG